MYIHGIYYVQWISKFHFHVFICNSMLYTDINAMDKDNLTLKPEMFKEA